MVTDPWNGLTVPQATKETSNNANILKFEDDFEQAAVDEQSAGEYVALDDSEQYLSKLERKLNRVSGSSGPSSSRALLAGLSASRQTHQHALLSDTGPSSFSVGELDCLPRARGVLLAENQHHLNSIIQKLAPEKLALSAEELVKLLAADSLAARTDRETADETLADGKTSNQADAVADVTVDSNGSNNLTDDVKVGRV